MLHPPGSVQGNRHSEHNNTQKQSGFNRRELLSEKKDVISLVPALMSDTGTYYFMAFGNYCREDLCICRGGGTITDVKINRNKSTFMWRI